MEILWLAIDGLRILVLVFLGSIILTVLGVAGLLLCYYISDRYEDKDGCC